MAAKRVVVFEERSLERMADALERRQAAEEDDAEAAFYELIRDLADIRSAHDVDDELIQENEFVCNSCHLVLHRSRLGNRRVGLCVECAHIT
jgi:sugar phosphate isomerase/epimerase